MKRLGRVAVLTAPGNQKAILVWITEALQKRQRRTPKSRKKIHLGFGACSTYFNAENNTFMENLFSFTKSWIAWGKVTLNPFSPHLFPLIAMGSFPAPLTEKNYTST